MEINLLYEPKSDGAREVIRSLFDSIRVCGPEDFDSIDVEALFAVEDLPHIDNRLIMGEVVMDGERLIQVGSDFFREFATSGDLRNIPYPRYITLV